MRKTVGLLLAVPLLVACEKAPQTVTWKPCGEGAQCGSVSVPVDWDQPDGARMPVAVVRRMAPQGKSLGTLVYLPGGPGGSGVETIAGSPEFGGLEKVFDIVSLDPRGVGKSSPLTCPTDAVKAVMPTSLPRTDAELDAVRRKNLALAQECRKASGPAFDHLDSASAARDLEAVRQALGVKEINLYAHSYGTLLAQEYAARFGGTLRSAVLDGTMDHSATARTFASTAGRALDEAFGEFVRWCGKDRACSLHGKDPAAAFARMGADYGVRAEIDGMLFTPAWPIVADYLKTLSHGKKWTAEPAEDERPGKTVNYADPIVCQDFDLRYSSAAALRADLGAGYSPNAAKAILSCQGWPSPVANPQRPARSVADHPMLLVQSRYDNATPLAWSRAVAGQLGDRGSLVVLPDWTHAMKLFNEGCQADLVKSYLIAPGPRTAPTTCTTTPPGVKNP
ncbi:alpha/beta fold hydrolase [Nonomuraea sp. NPDC050556]|uniref:alpha/beta fold hydrolase n=1 Tax=Nonomuraea sp. NPDC050556 TaxID=3364369 RepID=UPI0037B39B29